jgi:hypothetical protein
VTVAEYRVSVEAAGAAARPAWAELVERNPEVALSKTPDWVDCIRGCDRFRDDSLLFLGADGRRFVLPRLGVPGLPGVYASPPEHWNLGADASGFLGEGGPPGQRELRALVGELHRRRGLRTRVVVGRDEARQWSEAVPGSVHAVSRTAHVLDLAAGFESIWTGRFTSKVRSNCRKAERRGVTVESDDTGRLVPVFYELYQRSVDRWARDRGYPVPLMRWRTQRLHPRAKFEEVARALGRRCCVWVARRDGEPIAATVVLTRGSRVTYWRGAMDKDRSRGTGANELIHRHAIDAACAGGYHSYDFGLSQTDDLRRFKASFGTQEVPVHMYFFERLRTTAAAERGTASAKRAVRMTAGFARRLTST